MLTIRWEKGRGVLPIGIEEADKIRITCSLFNNTIGGTYYVTDDDPLMATHVAAELFGPDYVTESDGDLPQLPYEEGAIY